MKDKTKKSKNTEKFLLYFQFVQLADVHVKKDMEIALSFSRMGYESTILIGETALSDASDYYKNELKILQTQNIRTSKKLNIKDYANEFYKALTFLNQEKPNLVVVIHPWVLAPLIIWTYKIRNTFKINCKTKFLLHMDSDGTIFREGALKVFWRFVLVFNNLIFDKIIMQSNSSAKRIKDFLIFKRRLIIIPAGYSTVRYRRVGYDEVRRNNVILSTARIVRTKGLDILLQAFAKVHNSFPNWMVFIVGPLEDKVYYNELSSMLIRYGLQNNVKFFGYVSEEDLKSLYLHAKIFCLPSRSEGFPISICEAAACGLAFVGSEAGPGTDLAEYGALIGRVGDIKWLACTLGKLMGNEELCRNVSRSLQKHIVSWDEIAQTMIDSVHNETIG